MTEYIVRESGYPGTIKQEIVGELVRCKECKSYKRDIPCVGGTYNGCEKLEGQDGCEMETDDDWFCAYGERREER